MYPRLVLSGLAASVSPVSISVLVAILAGPDARRNSLSFLAGYTLLLAAVGFAALAFLHGTGTARLSPRAGGCADVAIGALCLVAALNSALRKGGKRREKRALTPRGAFAVGVVTMAVNLSTWVCYSAGLREIVGAGSVLPGSLLPLALLILLTLFTLLIPLALYFAFPERTRRLLDHLAEILQRRGKAIGISVLLLFGVYLLAKGILACA